MSESLGCCAKRTDDEVPQSWSGQTFKSFHVQDDEGDEAERLEYERERMLSFVEEPDRSQRHSQLARFYSLEELGELESFIQEYNHQNLGDLGIARANSLIDTGHGPWGIRSAKGGTTNAWDSVDAETFNVRGPTYLKDRKKVKSGPAIGELAVLDLFMSDVDIANVARSDAAKTIERLRGEGEFRKLVVLNFRLLPLHCVMVWAVPDSIAESGPAGRLLDRFLTDMPDAERNKRLKVIPRLAAGPWPARRLVGENSPAILAKNIPIDYFASENEFEISVCIAQSTAAQRVSKTLMRAGTAIDIEIVVLIEAQDASELPEQVLGSFRIIHADLTSVRHVDHRKACKEDEAKRPSFLPDASA